MAHTCMYWPYWRIYMLTTKYLFTVSPKEQPTWQYWGKIQVKLGFSILNSGKLYEVLMYKMAFNIIKVVICSISRK